MQQTTQDIIKQLQAPFPAAAIKWRVGDRQNEGRQGQALPYIDARDVQNRLDEVVGPENWEVTMKPSSVGIISGIRILLNGHWVTKEDGAQFDNFKVNDYNSNSKELAIKGAFSDAFKRAAVMWGIARYLYAFSAPVVELDQNGQLKSIPKLPVHMLPESERGTEPTGDPQSKTAEASETPADAAATPVAAAETVEPTPAPTPPAEPEAEQPSEPEKVAQASNDNSDGERDERDDRADALADAAANESSVHEATPAPAPAPAPAPVAVQPPAASTGPKVVKGIDYSSLRLSESEEKVVIDLLEKVALALEGKFPAAALKTYVNGGKLKDKLNEPARQWVSKLLSGEKDQAQAA